jgi:hypothetical protein
MAQRGGTREVVRLAVYRCYGVDKDGHFVDVETLDCFNDVEALANAEEMARRMGWLGYELWDLARKVTEVCWAMPGSEGNTAEFDSP